MICKECKIEKQKDCFYKHPLTKSGRMGKCIECIKTGRRSEKERIMARVQDRKRANKPERIKYITENTRKYRKNNPQKYNAHKIVSNFFRNNKRPDTCYKCGYKGKLEFHHYDYSKPRSIIPLCSICHKGHHKGIIDISDCAVFNF